MWHYSSPACSSGGGVGLRCSDASARKSAASTTDASGHFVAALPGFAPATTTSGRAPEETTLAPSASATAAAVARVCPSIAPVMRTRLPAHGPERALPPSTMLARAVAVALALRPERSEPAGATGSLAPSPHAARSRTMARLASIHATSLPFATDASPAPSSSMSAMSASASPARVPTCTARRAASALEMPGIPNAAMVSAGVMRTFASSSRPRMRFTRCSPMRGRASMASRWAARRKKSGGDDTMPASTISSTVFSPMPAFSARAKCCSARPVRKGHCTLRHHMVSTLCPSLSSISPSSSPLSSTLTSPPAAATTRSHSGRTGPCCSTCRTLPQPGHLEGATKPSACSPRSPSTGPSTRGITSPARSITTVSPSRTPMRRAWPTLCRVVREMSAPPISTGRTRATGTTWPVRPTATLRFSSTDVACRAGGLSATAHRGSEDVDPINRCVSALSIFSTAPSVSKSHSSRAAMSASAASAAASNDSCADHPGAVAKPTAASHRSVSS
mmetsp:Transcript_8937/g.36464  ORF Transcript_8937/g.36464 Transcript_8937/m.36464 type:complete len:506 (-) Transcript_8937:288-1805(-)